MLSSALNFLSDKRKRFHRSDTMPTFHHDPNLFKLSTDLPDAESNSNQSSFHQYHISTSPPARSTLTQDDLAGLRIDIGSNGNLTERGRPFTLDDVGIQAGSKRITFAHHTKIGGSDKNLNSRFMRERAEQLRNNYADGDGDDGDVDEDEDDSPSPHHTHRNFVRRNQEAKLKFLNLPVTTLTPNSIQSCSHSGTDGSPTPSMISWNSKKSAKEDVLGAASDRDFFKQSTLKVENMETVVISSSSSYKENDPSQFASDEFQTTAKSRVARLQTKSARATKNKVKRSKSTVHMSRHMRDSSQEEVTRERACSAQRKPLQTRTDSRWAEMVEEPKLQTVKPSNFDKPLNTTTLGLTTGNRTQSGMPPYMNQEGVTTQDIRRNYELLLFLARRGSKNFYYRINALENAEADKAKISDPGPSIMENGVANINDIGGSTNMITGNITGTNSFLINSAQSFCSDKTKFSGADSPTPSSTTPNPNTSSSKLNKYAVVRRLRRNNSSMTCTTTEKTFRSFDEPVSTNSTCSSAGDLLLPSRHLNHAPLFAQRSITSLTQDRLIMELFNLVDRNDVEHFLRQFEQFHLLARNLAPDSERFQNTYELNPLDCALLNGYIPLSIYLIICGFGPGPILQYSLRCGPSVPKGTLDEPSNGGLDTMRVHLRNLISESDAKLVQAHEDTKQTVEEANHLTQSIKQAKETSTSQITALNQIYAKVGLKEQVLNESIIKQDQLLKFSRILDQYPTKTRPPQRVRLLHEGPQSILVRITPPRLNMKRTGLISQTEIVYNEKSSCDSSDDLESFDPLNEGRKFSLGAQSDLASLITLKYRIEWSQCPKFLNAPVYSCMVEPVFHLHGIYQHGESIQIRNLNQLGSRTGFYVVSNPPVGKMVFIRVFAFSIHGWSEPCYSQPPGINLSNWYECKAITNGSGISQQQQQRYVGDSLVPEIDLQKQLLIEKVVSWISGHTSASTTTTTSTTNVIAPTSSNVSIINSSNANASSSVGTILQPTQSSNGSVPSGPSLDDSSKRNKSPMLQRKRSFRFIFSNKGFRIVKQVKSGLYLAIVCHTPIPNTTQLGPMTPDLFKQKHQLVLADDSIPMINVTREDVFSSGGTSNLSADFNWFCKLVTDSTGDMDVQLLCEDALRSNLPTNLHLRIRLFGALQRLRFLLGTANMGTVYPEMIKSKLIDPNLLYQKLDSEDSGRLKQPGDFIDPSFNDNVTATTTKKNCSSAIIVLLRQVHSTNDVSLTSNLRWCTMDKFLRQNKIKRMDFWSHVDRPLNLIIPNTERMMNQLLTQYSHMLSTRGDQVLVTPESLIISNMDSLVYYSAYRNRKLEPGLYLALLQMQANLDQQATILVSNASSALQMIPCQRIRHRSHVSRDEWELFYHILNQSGSPSELVDQRFEIRDAERRFVVQLLRAWFKLADKLGFPNPMAMQYRIYLSEIIHLSPQHSIILCFPPVDQVCLRPGLITVTPASCYWTSMAHFERHLGLVYDPLFYPQLFHLMSLLELLIPMSQFIQRQCFTDRELSYSTERTQSLQLIQSNLETMMQGKRWLSESLAAGRDRKRQDLVTIGFEKLFKAFYTWLPGSILNFFSGSESGNQKLHLDTEPIQIDESSNSQDSPQLLFRPPSRKDSQSFFSAGENSPDKYTTSSVIQVYADYPSGLASGTYVRLLIYSKTTAKEIIHIVLHQIRQTAHKRASHYLSTQAPDLTSSSASSQGPDEDDLESLNEHSFCLTVSLGHVERQLAPAIRPLLLRHPWRSGKFAVRLLNQVTKCLPTQKQQERQQQQLNSNNLTSFTNEIRPYRISQRHAFKLTIVENPFAYAHINPPPHIMP